MPKSSKTLGRLEAQQHETELVDTISCPRMVARIWGMITGISYMSSGGYFLVHGATKKCSAGGSYMLAIGILLIVLECPCALFLIQPGNKCCDFMEKKVPYWAKGLIYLLLMLPSLILCFSWKTMLTSLTMIILALLYFFLTCLLRSKRYERLRGHVNSQLQEKREAATVSYNALSHASATISAFQSSTKHKNTAKVKVKQPGKTERKYKKMKT
eukprot:Seg331.3 transcript_id=Seg331.3/GoldUCD/mRNA.D3Y31 product="hypothetical protein" protein_id=Seg331.3/GoldUCD/D3Y31